MKNRNKLENRIKADRLFAELVECIEGMRDRSIVLESVNTANQNNTYRISSHAYPIEVLWENLVRYL